MRRLMIGLVGVCLALGKGGLVSADMIVIGSPELLHGYSPNPTSVEYPTYLSPDGDFMLVRSTTNDIGSRTWDTGTGQWGAVTPLSGISGSGYNYATLSPDGNSMFLGSSGVIQRSKLQLSGTWSTPQTIVPGGVNVYLSLIHI